MSWQFHRHLPNRRWLTLDVPLFLVNRLVAYFPSRRLRLAVYRHLMGFCIGPHSFVFMGVRFDALKNLTIADHSVINQGCRLDTRGGITIGSNVSISEEVCILTADHDPRDPQFRGRMRPVRIDDFAFVGTRAMILPGVHLGRGAVVAAGAVVTKDVPPLQIVAGCPAKCIGLRSDKLDYTINHHPLFT